MSVWTSASKSKLKISLYFITTMFALHFAKWRHLSGGGDVDRFRKCSIYVDIMIEVITDLASGQFHWHQPMLIILAQFNHHRLNIRLKMYIHLVSCPCLWPGPVGALRALVNVLEATCARCAARSTRWSSNVGVVKLGVSRRESEGVMEWMLL